MKILKNILKCFFDLIFIDGDHSYDAVKNDYNVCKKQW